MHTDAEWEKWGEKDPYFGVITLDKFRRSKITDEVKREFFKSGENHINHVLEVCRRHIDKTFIPKKVLDFGCGVGRLVLPLAELAEGVVGLDVSESMLKEARINCEKRSLTNVKLLKTDDDLSSLDCAFDFIHSFIVFQHIPVIRGSYIFTKLLDHLEGGGICALQFTYSKTLFNENYGAPILGPLPNKERILSGLKHFIYKALSYKKSPQKSEGDPEMQMNPYNVNELLFLMQTAGIENFHVEFTDHGGELGVFLYFQKPKSA